MTDSPATAPHAWVDVDLDAIVANARHVVRVSSSRLLPMVKANAYGLGAVPVVRALASLDPWGFGVATIDEGRELRQAGITLPIVVFSPLVPAWVPAMKPVGTATPMPPAVTGLGPPPRPPAVVPAA